MEGIWEKARELGRLLGQSDEYKLLQRAKDRISNEREMVAGIAGSRAVVATGGGVPLDASNRDLMRATGKVVWLDASAHAIEARLAGSADRPVLTDLGDDGVAGLLERRRPFYESIADLSVDTTQRDIDEIVDRIAAWALAAGFPDD